MSKYLILVTKETIHDDFWQNEELKKYTIEFVNKLIKNLGYCGDIDCSTQCVFNSPDLGDVFKKHMCAYMEDRDAILIACHQLLEVIQQHDN